MKTMLIVLAFISFVFAQEAPFGLTWGSTVTEVSKVATLTKLRADNNMTLYKTLSLPKNHSLKESYVLVFSKGKLVKVGMVSVSYENDLYGTEGVEGFERVISQLITNGYVLDSKDIIMGLELYEESYEFYQCLKYTGCGAVYAYLNKGGTSVLVQLKGLVRGVGYLDIMFESSDFHNARQEYDNSKNNKDLSSF